MLQCVNAWMHEWKNEEWKNKKIRNKKW